MEAIFMVGQVVIQSCLEMLFIAYGDEIIAGGKKVVKDLRDNLRVSIVVEDGRPCLDVSYDQHGLKFGGKMQNGRLSGNVSYAGLSFEGSRSIEKRKPANKKSSGK